MSRINPLVITISSVVVVALLFIAFLLTNNSLQTQLEASSSEVSNLKSQVGDLASKIVIEQDLIGIKGDTGPAGEKGESGEKGVQGEQGVQGPQGAQGVQGHKGDTGSNGVSGYQYVCSAESHGQGPAWTPSVTCPNNKKVLSTECVNISNDTRITILDWGIGSNLNPSVTGCTFTEPTQMVDIYVKVCAICADIN